MDKIAQRIERLSLESTIGLLSRHQIIGLLAEQQALFHSSEGTEALRAYIRDLYRVGAINDGHILAATLEG